MVRRIQYFAFFLIPLILFGLSFQNGMARPLNTLEELHNEEVIRSTITIVEGHGQREHTRTLEVTNSGPSPGEGHKKGSDPYGLHH
ncbi:putative transmembrane protein [Sesbania bispinosa]|nr:putative transmembrane protein [Sesbania bispinosa]